MFHKIFDKLFILFSNIFLFCFFYLSNFSFLLFLFTILIHNIYSEIIISSMSASALSSLFVYVCSHENDPVQTTPVQLFKMMEAKVCN